MKRSRVFYRLCPSPFGPVSLVWQEHRGRAQICHVLLSSRKIGAARLTTEIHPQAVKASSSEIDAIGGRIEAFLSGEKFRFSLEWVRMDLCSSFQQSVLRAEHGIPRGWVSTYQRIAGHLGNPGSARAVGTALAKNPFPIIIPCHRAIRSDGSLGGYQGGVEMKRALLEMEGILFNARGKVATERFFY